MALEKTIQLVIKAKDEASAILSRVGTGMKDFGVAAGKALIGLGVAAAGTTAAIAAIVQKTLNFGDDLGKVSDQLGITTEALSGLRLAGDLAGISAGELDKGIRTLQRNIAEAADGTAAQADAFKNLGLSIDAIKRQSPEEQFITIVGALNKVEDQTQKTQIALDLFGRAGAKALNLTEEGLRGALKESDAFGLSISRVDAAKMEDVNDATTRVKTAFQGAGTQLTIALLEPLKNLAARLVELAKNGTLQEWARKVGDAAGSVIEWVTNTILATGKLEAAFNIVSGGFNTFVGAVQIAVDGLAVSFSSSLRTIVEGLSTLTFGKIGFIEDAKKSIIDFNKGAVQSFGESVDKVKNGVKQIGDGFDGLDKKANDSGKSITALATSTEKLGKKERDLKKDTDAVSDSLKKQKDDADKLALKYEEIASNERIKTIELAVNLKTAQVEAEGKKIEAVFSSIGNTVTSTGNLIDSLFSRQGQPDSNGFTVNRQVEDQLKKETLARDDALRQQSKLNEVQIQNLELQNERLRDGGGLITITADGLEPELEAFMFKIVERVQVRVTESLDDFLLVG